MRHKWTTFRRLSAAERRLFVQAAVLLPLTVAALRLVGFRRTQSVLERWGARADEPGRAGPEAAAPARAAARMVRLAATRGLTRPRCLPRALVLCALLRRRGVEAELRIGVGKRGDALDAHAWVEAAGLTLDDFADTTARFAPFETLGPRKPAHRLDHAASPGGRPSPR